VGALISLGCWLTLPFSRRRCALTRPAGRAACRRECTGKFGSDCLIRPDIRAAVPAPRLNFRRYARTAAGDSEPDHRRFSRGSHAESDAGGGPFRSQPGGSECLPRCTPRSSRRRGDLYAALCPELDVASQGATVEEATSNVREAVELLLECADSQEVKRGFGLIVFVTRIEGKNGWATRTVGARSLSNPPAALVVDVRRR
jgi:hypothetical protein